MIAQIKSLIRELHDDIVNDLNKGNNVQILLDAYNYWREQECDGVDYIFDINNKDDLKFLVNHDMITSAEIAYVFTSQDKRFVYNETHNNIELLNFTETLCYITDSLENILMCMFMYVNLGGLDKNPYCVLYNEYITKPIQDNFDLF